VTKKDGDILLKMAEAWDGRTDEAERQRRKNADGNNQHMGGGAK